MDYTINDGEYYKVLNADSGKLISTGKMEEGNVLSTIHTVEWISEEEYLASQDEDGAA